MIKFEQAIEIVLSHTLETGQDMIPLTDSMGHFLAVNISADRDMPPFNKSAVDGYACRGEDTEKNMRVIENIPAGYSPTLKITEGCCSKIMTGAKLPDGADTVIMVEEVVEVADASGFIRYSNPNGKKLKNNICLKGEDIKEGELVLEAGTFVKPQHIAILAAMGISKVPVFKSLNIGVLSTGDEIVEPDIVPKEVQIRNSNGWQLRAQVTRSGAVANYYGTVPDNEKILKAAIEQAIVNNDILILTGGVSMGDFDFVPSILKELNFEILFDKVAVQPGKPSTFAIKMAPGSNKTEKVIFALPGNPVSSFIQFELLIKPFIFKSMHAGNPSMWIEMPSAQDYKRKNTDRKALIPVIAAPDGSFSIINYNGSAHILALDKANAIAEVPEGVSSVGIGDKLRVFLLQ